MSGPDTSGIRREMALWGLDLDDVSDEEIIAGCDAFGRAAAQAGISARELAESMTQFRRGLRGFRNALSKRPR